MRLNDAVFIVAFAVPTLVLAQRADTTVRMAGSPKHATVPRFVSELKIGTADGAEEYQFTFIQEVLVAADGKVWIVNAEERKPPDVRMFDASGKFVRRVGRTGGGPGEYQSICGIAQLPDGRVLIRDEQQSRINVYRADGTPDTTWQFTTRYAWLRNGSGGVRVDPNGVVWLPFFITQPTGRIDSYVRLRATGVILDSIEKPVVTAPAPARGVEVRSKGGGLSLLGNDPFASRAMSVWSPLGYFVTGVTSRYAFELRMPRKGARDWQPGDPIVSVRRASAPVVSVTRAERDNYLAIYKYRLDAAVAQGGVAEHGLPEIGPTKAPYERINPSADGRIWVLVSAPSEPYDPPGYMDRPDLTREPSLKWRAPTVYDVFEPDGAFVGRIPFPRDVYSAYTKGDVMWLVSRDDDGSSFLTKTRLEWK